ncbi:MAG: N-6 DNA methylase [Alphaproteobacteria bacterium]|nr:N-6 DNA methylase [Alphaproteobacteria bacterium]
MNEYPILFTEKYLNDKFSFNDFVVPDADAKIKVLQQWETEIRNRTIYNKKEEQLQSDFLNDIFGEVLGYAYKRGLKEYNLEKEEKSKTDGTKPDGVLGFLTAESKDIRVVIELKDAYTNLDHKQNRKNDNRTPVEQAFSYVAKSGGNCKWVVVSNFTEIRLYPANDSSFYQRFMVKDLVRLDVLKSFYVLLSNGNLFCQTSESVVDKLLQHKIEADTKITKEFYNDYRRCRTALFNHIKENNPSVDDNTALSKSQKILDRIIFICFCEDIGLLPYKVFKIILEEAKNSRFDVRETKLWERTKALFSMIDKGYPIENINRFNGGLFKDDEIIDNFVIKDSVLADIIALESYDFESDLNVNILGHIFEQSITDLEELKASFRGETIDKKKGKRKKDGIFYTPEYITKYIVSEAVGGWLDEKKHELGYDDLPKIDEEQWIRIRKGNIQKNNQTIKKHLDFWLKYREILNNIKVLDPACGSGSFLVQVFSYLKEQSRLVKEEIATLQGLQPDLFNEDSHILSHNIYGVDLNPESVEITKLALWLKTANKNDPLTSLDDNIKCGNSLVYDATIDAKHAFDWSKEFSEIMNSGGFDVIVGNPPYVSIEMITDKDKKYYESKYTTAVMRFDLYSLFIEQSYNILNNHGKLGFIIPAKYLNNTQFSTSRKRLLDGSISVVSIDDKVFSDASVDSIIIIYGRKSSNEYRASILKNSDNILLGYSDLSDIIADKSHIFRLNQNNETNKIISKIERNTICLSSIAEIKDGIIAGMLKDILFIKDKSSSDAHPLLFGKDVNKYSYNFSSMYVNYNPDAMMQEEIKRKNGKAVGLRMRTTEIFERTKILSRQIGSKIIATLDSNNMYYEHTLHSTYITDDNYDIKYILALYNSKLFAYYYPTKNSKGGKTFPQIRLNLLGNLPIKPVSPKQQQPFINLVDTMLAKNKELQELSTKFINMLKGDFRDVIINNALTNWYELEWPGFIDALKKQKIVLSGTLKDDWFDRYNRFATEIKAISAIINDTDKQIDAAVYKLYNLTDSEIKVIEEQV